jgi:hypothetical protein
MVSSLLLRLRRQFTKPGATDEGAILPFNLAYYILTYMD